MQPSVVLVCDLGGTRLKLGVMDRGRLLASATAAVDSRQGLGSHLPRLRTRWGQLLEGLGLGWADCAGVAMAFPSLMDPLSGRVLDHYGKYADAPDVDLRAWAKAELSLPLVIENDARLALVGEWQYGVARGCDNLVIITLGTGLGTAVVMEGRLVRGRHGQAGVLCGHSTVDYAGRACTCGNVGCAEAEASSVVLKEMIESSEDFADSALVQEEVLDFAAVFRHAASGDPCACRLRDHSLRVWGALAVNLIHAYDPEMLVLGGGIMGSAEVVLPAIREYVVRHAHTPWGSVRIVASALGDAAALMAGEWLFWEQSPDGRGGSSLAASTATP